MNNDVQILPLIDAGYSRIAVDENNVQNAFFKGGRLVYLILDINKPGKYFFDLTPIFNASTGEGGKTLPILFMANNTTFNLNNKSIQIHGWYPSGVDFHVTGAAKQAQPSIINFNFPQGLFQEAGVYKFQFEIFDQSGNCATSHYCFFQVTPNAVSMAFDWNNGVNPYDSDYMNWKSEVDKQIQTVLEQLKSVNTAADADQALLNSYINKAQSYVETATQDAINKLLSSENVWTSKQHFNNGLTFSNNAQGDTLVANTVDTGDLTATGTVTLPNTTSFGDFKANQILNAVLVPGFSGMLMNATKNANDQGQWNKNWWLWASKVNIGVGVDYPCYIMHFDLTLDTSDVGKPIATFNNSVFASSNNAGSTQAVYMNGTGGTMTYHVDSTGVLYLDSISGISGKGRVRFTGLF